MDRALHGVSFAEEALPVEIIIVIIIIIIIIIVIIIIIIIMLAQWTSLCRDYLASTKCVQLNLIWKVSSRARIYKTELFNGLYVESLSADNMRQFFQLNSQQVLH